MLRESVGDMGPGDNPNAQQANFYKDLKSPLIEFVQMRGAVMTECPRARTRGARVEGVCLYPVADHPGWDDDRLCPNGLLGHDPVRGTRTVDAPLALRIAAGRMAAD